MLINTNGFEIGDEVWVESIKLNEYVGIELAPYNIKIKGFAINDMGEVFIIKEGFEKELLIFKSVLNVYKTEFECLEHILEINGELC